MTRPGGLWLFAHHDRPVNRELCREVIRACVDERDQNLRAKLEQKLDYLEKVEYRSALGFRYWPSFNENRPFVPVRMSLWVPSGMENGPGRMLDMPFCQEPLGRHDWFEASVDSDDGVDLTDPAQVNWVLDTARKPFKILRPDFAFADKPLRVSKHAGAKPRERAWPVLYYGPTMIERWGRDHLLQAPVWRAEETPEGGVWLQLKENPLARAPGKLKALADYLELAAPG